MPWVKVDDLFPQHPKTLGLSNGALGVWLHGLCYAARNRTDGRLPATFLRSLPDPASAEEATELVDAGLWEPIERGWQIHDYLDHQRSKAEIDELSTKRAEAGRKGGRAKQTPSNLLPGSQANAKQNGSKTEADTDTDTDTEAEKNTNGADAPSSDAAFDAFWLAYPNKTEKKAARDQWQKLKPDAALQTDILAAIDRQKEGRKWREGYVKAPHRWLRDRNWTDEVEPAAPALTTIRGGRANGRAEVDWTNADAVFN